MIYAEHDSKMSEEPELDTTTTTSQTTRDLDEETEEEKESCNDQHTPHLDVEQSININEIGHILQEDIDLVQQQEEYRKIEQEKAATDDFINNEGLPEQEQIEEDSILTSQTDLHREVSQQFSSITSLQVDSSSHSISNLEVNSLVQLPPSKPDSPLRYGVIKWIGSVPETTEVLAGIELEEPMEGCTDGTCIYDDSKYFDCPEGFGTYYPLIELQPDKRLEESEKGNPLKDVIEAEVTIEGHIPLPINVANRYIGDKRGIQGHYNSCYLDATLFGLFALTMEFDDMFLHGANESTNSISQTLWKNVVNPLRIHGVVRYESVMKLREQLEQLEKMKGITQDEKDPEEFLNLMFKHSLKIPPFISIRRPFGVEEEYFVQLFLEFDESMKLPSIGDLLSRMFVEQQISFTEIPSKLLIQVPRFGKKFKMFQKIFPVKTLNVARNVNLTTSYQCSECDASDARNVCQQCKTDLKVKSPYFCDECSKLRHGKRRMSRHKVEYSQEMQDLTGASNLELLSVICIETSHYVCFTRHSGNQWVFFDSMASRVYDQYNIPKVVDCTADLNKWVYPENGDLSPLLETSPRDLPEYVRRFTQDIYMCVYIKPNSGM